MPNCVACFVSLWQGKDRRVVDQSEVVDHRPWLDEMIDNLQRKIKWKINELKKCERE